MDSAAAVLAAACLVLAMLMFMGSQKADRRIKRLEEEVARLTGRTPGSAVTMTSSGPVLPGHQAAGMDEVTELVRNGKKIQAIKRYRELTGAGLKEAKDAVEAM